MAPMSRRERHLQQLLARGGTMRSQELERAGVTRSEISRMVAAGKVVRVARGLYSAAGYQGSEHSALVAVAKRVPRTLFCLLTALRFHGLTSQAPFEVWIAIGNKARAPRLDYPPIRAVRFTAESLAAGVETHRLENTAIRVTSPAKTVADCFKFRNKIGIDVALEALREVHRTRNASTDDLWRHARLNRVANVMRPYLEAVT